MWELAYKASWALKNWCFWTVLEKTLESPSDCKEIKPVNPKGSRSWIFIGRTDAKVETPILWLPDAKNWLIWKDLDAGKDGRQKEKEMTKDEMVGWHHWLDGHEFGDGQGSLSCCRPWVAKSQTWLSDWTEVSSPKHLLFQSSCGSRTWAWLSQVRVSGCPTKLLSGIGCWLLTTWLGRDLVLSTLRWIATRFVLLQDVGQNDLQFFDLRAYLHRTAHSVTACFMRISKQEDPEKERGRERNGESTNQRNITVMDNLISEVTFPHLGHVLSIKNKTSYQV